ncbi:uncharacterized protein LOC115309969 [Ixodes scapularis]|uniref:uncharacterized protein LOC115309969 n=1 Tax=Ixodes scapularis TaxID=6945 RepID=UPI001A9D4957|nr:uncharacterized protein LOC115309969 [Ixodes scapularis]
MAWTMQVTFLCLVLKLNLAEADFKDAVDYIYNNSQAVRLLFLRKMTFYVVGGTFEEDPVFPLDPTGIPFKCAEVHTEKKSDDKFSLERRIWTHRLPNNWLNSTYDIVPKTSSGYGAPNYMDIYRIYGNRTQAGTMYLLLSDVNSCALLYHEKSSHCELWETQRPGKDGLPSSFCSSYIHACNNNTVIWYYNDTVCHRK